MNRRDAALHLAHRYPGGLDAVGHRMGKRGDTLRKELTGQHGYKWGADDEDMLVALCQAAGVPDALAPITAAAANAGALVVPLPGGVDLSSASFTSLAEAMRECGEFVQSAAAAEADGRVTANELKHVEREVGQLLAACQRVLAHVRAVHEAGKPAHLQAVGR
jgi:hypothetical protein